MTDAPRKKPTSTPVLLATLKWGSIVTVGLVVVGGLIGYLVGGVDGMWSALAGVLLSAVFLAITATSILVANRWYGDALYVPIFFGIVLGGWILKFIVFLVILFVLRDQPWLDGVVFYLGLVASILAGLLVDVIAMMRMRMLYASDVTLPGEEEDAAPAGDRPAEPGTPQAGP